MKVSFIALLFVAASSSASTMDVRHAEMNMTAAQAEAHTQHDASHTMQMDRDNLNAAGAIRAQAYADENSANMIRQNQAATAQQAHSVNATSYRLGVNQREQVQMGVASINVAVSSLKPSTAISTTTNGITKTTTAGEVAKTDPNVQVSVPHVSAFTSNHSSNDGNGKSAGHTSGAGDNNGQDNAHNNAVGRADGVGGHSEFR